VAALGLDFGGVDVMVKDNVAYVIEVNTAPTLNSSDYVALTMVKVYGLVTPF
jgi:glutathione synthase/RimK-type ligase-like ATP-grasp enzyme